MATYYVRLDGSDANTGLGSTASTAWRTIGKIFASGSVVTGGDIVYIAPGTYTESISVLANSPTSEVQIVGNPTASQFSGVNAGVVKLSAYNAAGTAVVYNNTHLITATSKNYYSFSNLVFEAAHTLNVSGIQFLTSRYIKFTKCVFRTENAPSVNSAGQVRLTATASTPLDAIFDQCYFGPSTAFAFYLTGASQPTDTTIIKNCYFDNGSSDRALAYELTATFLNCTFVGGTQGITQGAGSANAFITIKNCLFKRLTTAIAGSSLSSGVQTYNRFVGCVNTVTNIASSATSTSDGVFGVDTFDSLLFGLNNLQPGTSYADSPNKSFGIATGAPVTDLYGVTWTGTSPDAGAATYRPVGGVGAYYPSDRNESSVQITAGSVSRSLYLYLGATGLTATTTGLQAFYTKEDAAPVSIPLVAQTTTGAWVSGGFAEVSAANQPGVYRLDIPNAAISAGYTQTVVTVRGASGTNGAVVVIQEPPILGSQVRMGPFTVQADGVLTDERLKLFKGSIHSIDFKMVDQYGTGVDGTGTVVTANAYNSAGFLVDSYPCTAKYAEDGRYSFAIDATVTNVVGMYTINISRQIGSEINVFGRMKLEVLSP